MNICVNYLSAKRLNLHCGFNKYTFVLDFFK